jgi:hypothetical protein
MLHSQKIQKNSEINIDNNVFTGVYKLCCFLWSLSWVPLATT